MFAAMNRLLKSLLVLLFCFANAAYAQTASEPPAPGWVAYRQPTETDRSCGNYSKQEWAVTLNSDKSGILISRFKDSVRRYSIPVHDGQLVGENHGEFGGGLWWVSKDGRQRKRLSRENVHGFVRTSNAVLVITGLAHMGVNYGDVLRYVDGPSGKKRVEMLADLDWAPSAFTLESPETLMVLTSDGFVRVHTSGRVESVHRVVYGVLYPNSFTLSPNGVIHVGMRHFITRLTPSGGTYKEEWFVPANCTRFQIRDTDCVCSR